MYYIQCEQTFSRLTLGDHILAYLQLVLEEVARNCCEIGRNKKGYDVLTCIISSFKGHDHENSVLREIVANAVDLAYDQYG